MQVKRRVQRRRSRDITAQIIDVMERHSIHIAAAVAVIAIVCALILTLTDSKKTVPAAEMKESTTQALEPETTEAPMKQLETVPYPFNTMSQDWGAEDLVGFMPYEIPQEYAKTGGYFPECMQKYTYIICQQNGIDYALVLAMIEHESGYKWDTDSGSGDMGYMQVNPVWHAERMEAQQAADVLNPYSNIRVAIDYLAELQCRFDTEAEVLTAYNYGVTGAYQNVWNKGLTETEYSKAVQEIKARILKSWEVKESGVNNITTAERNNLQ